MLEPIRGWGLVEGSESVLGLSPSVVISGQMLCSYASFRNPINESLYQVVFIAIK